MFSDRLWILKVAVAAGLLAWLSHDAGRALQEDQPDIERVALFSDQLRDRRLGFSNKPVLAVDSTGVQVPTDVGPVHLRTTEKLEVGTTISAIVRLVGPRQLEVIRLRVHQGYGWKRAFTYGISVLTVLVYLWLVRRRFRWAPEAGVFRSRY
jgi:hypothetical protein